MTQIFGHEMLLSPGYKQFAIRNLPAGRGGKVFMNTGGDGLPVLAGWAKKGVHPVLAAQATWAGQSHNYNPSHFLKTAIKEAKRVNELAKDYPHLKFKFSPYCEHNCSATYMLKTFQELLPYSSHLQLVNSPNIRGVLVNGFPDEIHGKYNPSNIKPPYDWACDGMSAYDADMKFWIEEHNDADIIWLWIAQYNRKKNTKDDTEIKDRTVVPVENQVISLDYLAQYPKGDCNLPAKFIWKSHADQHYNKPSPREQKPVLICTVSANSAELFASNGKKIYTLERKGNYTDGRPLYRAENWGFQIAEKARKLTGSAVCTLKIDGVSYGKVNPAWRQNEYRTE